MFSFLLYFMFIQVKPQATPSDPFFQAFFILWKEISHTASWALIKIPASRCLRITKITNLNGGPHFFFLSYVLELQISPIEKTDAFLAISCPEIEKLRWSASKSCSFSPFFFQSCCDYYSFSSKYFSSK